MFDFLKKKISGFIEGLTKKEEEKEPEEEIKGQIPEEGPEIEELPEKEMEKVEIPPPVIVKKTETEKAEAKIPAKPVPKIETKKEEPKIEKEKKIEKPKIPKQVIGQPLIQQAPVKQIPKPDIQQIKKPEIEKEIAKPEIRKQPEAPKVEIKKPEIPRQEIQKEEIKSRIPRQETKPEPQKAEPPKQRIKLSPISAIKSFITSDVEIKEADVKEMLESLELELLESDVDMSVAQAITEDLSSKLIGAKIRKGELHPFITRSIRQTLIEVLTNDKSFDLLERLESAEKPMKIMFIGINGAGKTTTIAKVARLLMDGKKKVVFAAADTFRAAAIEQIEIHANRLGVKTIKRDYGSDPTSVAYDAVGYAKAHAIDAVLIDTAGRQDTNISLLNEIKKMSRVINPDLKIYIGESISGNAIVEQISAFNREVGIDAVILTKMDCDPKGGTMLSISKVTGIPIIYVGTGQAYTDLERFLPDKIAERIVG